MMEIEVDLPSPGALPTRVPSISTLGVDLRSFPVRGDRIGPHAPCTGSRRDARAPGVRCVAEEAFRLGTDSRPAGNAGR